MRINNNIQIGKFLDTNSGLYNVYSFDDNLIIFKILKTFNTKIAAVEYVNNWSVK